MPVRVIPSTASLTRRSEPESVSVEVALTDGTRLRFPAEASAEFIVEIITALRSAAC